MSEKERKLKLEDLEKQIRVESVTPDGGILYDVMSVLRKPNARKHIKSLVPLVPKPTR